MAKPLANHVISGREHEHTNTHAQSVLTSWLLPPDTRASTFFLKVTETDIIMPNLCVCVSRCTYLGSKSDKQNGGILLQEQR